MKITSTAPMTTHSRFTWVPSTSTALAPDCADAGPAMLSTSKATPASSSVTLLIRRRAITGANPFARARSDPCTFPPPEAFPKHTASLLEPLLGHG